MNGPGKVTETKTSYKTQGGDNVPVTSGQTVEPAQSSINDDTKAPFNHDNNDVSGYVAVSPEYRTYADLRNKPL